MNGRGTNKCKPKLAGILAFTFAGITLQEQEQDSRILDNPILALIRNEMVMKIEKMNIPPRP